MANLPWWKKSYQPQSTSPIKDCVICGANALNRCSQCSSVGYCGRDCQRKHWPEHKKECATLKTHALAAAAAAAQAKVKATVSPTSATSAPAAPTTPPSNATIPIATTELYPYVKFIQQWKSISLSGRVPCGLYNLGNTCYVNAILQVLLATRPLIAYLLTNEHTCPSPTAINGGYNSTVPKKQWCPLCCLVSLAQEVVRKAPRTAEVATRNPLTIRNFTHCVHQLNSSFTFGDQHDAQELYVGLLDALECVFLRETEASTEGGAAATAKLDQFSKQTTLLNHVFTCYTRTQVICQECGKVSKSYTSDTGIMLSVPEEERKFFAKSNKYTLENLLENFTAVEILQGEDAYRCDACCARVTAHKSNVIEIAPNILAIQLSRVGMNFFSAGGEMPQKNSAAVEFPLELDLTPFMAVDALDAAPAVYQLYAVVTHEGNTTEDGHYISVVRFGGAEGDDSQNGDGDGGGATSSSSLDSLDSQVEEHKTTHQSRHWYVCDDDVISPLSVDILLKQQEEAYLLFYERKQPRMPHLLGGSGGGGALETLSSDTPTTAAAVNGSSPLSETVVEKVKLTTTPTTAAEMKPRANGTDTIEFENDEEGEDGAGVSYVFKMEELKETGARALRLQVHLPTVVDNSPEIDLEPGKPVLAEVRCGECRILKMPLPVQVALPAREIKWNKDAKDLDVLFDAL